MGRVLACPACTGPLPWIPLLAASVNPEETPFFRKELTEETHKSEGERVRGGKEWKKGWVVKEDRESWDTPWEHGGGVRCDVSILQSAPGVPRRPRGHFGL